jgi:hypothetical protein
VSAESTRRYDMDIYDYNEDSLSTIARSCKYLNYRHPGKNENNSPEVSCSDCSSWNGSGCGRKQPESIASELQLD